MKSELSLLLLLFLLIHWEPVNCLCSLDKNTAAHCHELEDARYIDTYNLHVLRAPSSSKLLTPGNFKNLTSLRQLDLSGGRIERIESGSFAKLSSLQMLNLAENRLSELEPGAFDGLKHLRSLHLRKNQIRQLPSALMNLKQLKFLDISENPLNCNCASLKLRDALLSRGVKISKKTQCAEPLSAKNASILKPDSELTCELETQDYEMQGDEPAEETTEGSGEAEEDAALEEVEKDLDKGDEEKEVEQPAPADENVEGETAAPPTSTESSSSVPTTLTTSAEVTSEEIASSSTAPAKDDITFEDTEEPSKEETTTETTMIKPEESDDLIVPVIEHRESDTSDDSIDVSEEPKPEKTDDLIVANEGSGESDDDGSGAEDSGISIAKPGDIDFNETSVVSEEDQSPVTSSTSTTTTESAGLWGFVGSFWPFGGATEVPDDTTITTTTTTTTTEKSPEEVLKEDDLIPVKPDDVEETITTAKPVATNEIRPKIIQSNDSDSTLVDEGGEVDRSVSQESKKGMGSYVVLATLLAILGALIAFAAYKGDFCRKKRKRRDVERGTELKDMQKSLLDQNTAQPKVQPSNGNTLENVPLMNSSAPPEEPKDNQRSYDITPAPVTNGANGSNRPVGWTADVVDPVKPPRKVLNQEIEAPLNGLNPPMDDIDGPTRDSYVSNGDCEERPPLSPGAQRVKITLQENPDSVPKTPILITRLNGENIAKAP